MLKWEWMDDACEGERNRESWRGDVRGMGRGKKIRCTVITHHTYQSYNTDNRKSTLTAIDVGCSITGMKMPWGKICRFNTTSNARSPQRPRGCNDRGDV